MGSFVEEPFKPIWDPSRIKGIKGRASLKFGSLLPERQKEAPLITPTPVTSPAPTTVMAAQRAEADQLMRKKRRRATVMGGDYGALNVQTQKLGT